MEKVLASRPAVNRKEALIRRELENRNKADRMDELRRCNGWRDIQGMLEDDFSDKLTELLDENDVSRAFVIKSDLRATVRLASKIGATINIGESAKRNLRKALEQG